MRTTVEENLQVAGWMANKLNKSTRPIQILIPEKGVSLIDDEGQPFHDPEADAALFEALESQIEQMEERVVKRFDNNVNDAAFAEALVGAFKEVGG